MSETDDTDDLLLIPPDFFSSQLELNDSYVSGPYLNIVDHLITEVSHLQGRLNHLELAESTIGSSAMDGGRKYGSSDDILRSRDAFCNSSSTFSTPQKPRDRYKRPQPQPLTPSTSSELKPQQNGVDHRRQMLADIDKFIYNTGARCALNYTADAPKDDIIEVNGRIINLKDIEDILGEIETQKKLGDVRAKNQRVAYDNADGGRTYCGAKAGPCEATESTQGDKSASASSSDSTQTTARRKPVKLTVESLSEADINLSNNDALLSLKGLWGRSCRESFTSTKEKLEEEKMRRQHCEELIQELQLRDLELRERVAVAVRVDQAKDKAILKFHDAWEQMGSRLQDLTRERDELESTIRDLQTQREYDNTDAAKKISHHEQEAAKALHLVHSNQDKLSRLAEENQDLSGRLATVEARVREMEDRYRTEVDRNQKLNEIIVQKELEVKESKCVLTDSKKEVQQSKRVIEMCQSEFSCMKVQYAQLEALLNDKQSQIKELEAHKRTLLHENGNMKLLQKTLQDDIVKLKDSFEKNKVELRNFYQEQVEIVVRDKLREFQGQLDKAETSLQAEIRSRELGIARTAAGHIHQLTEKHGLEVNLLEEKHSEEVKLYKVKLSQSHQQLERLQQKMRQMNERRATIAEQLHKVMEAQWLEALKIINNGKSPATPHDGTLDQLYTLKSQSYSNLEEVLSEKMDESDEKKLNGQAGSSSSTLEGYSCGGGYGKLEETPVSSKMGKERMQIESDLQKYVQLLLNKQNYSSNADSMEDVCHDRSTCTADGHDEAKCKAAMHNRKGGKPPWK